MSDVRLNIRMAVKEDAKRIAEIEALCFPPGEAASLKEFTERLEVFSDSFFVGEIDGKVIAFVNGAVTDSKVIYDKMFHDPNEHKKQGFYQSIFGLCTVPNFQKKGIAEEMLNYMIQTAKARKKKGVTLTCKERLLHYYEKFGFKSLGISNSVHGGAVWYDMIIEF